MKMKRFLSLMLTAVLASSIALTGCGSSDSKETSSSGDSSKPIKLTITWWGSQSRHDITKKVLDLYTSKNPNITFETTPAGWDGYFDKLSALAAGDTMPDIIQMDYAYISTFTKNNMLADLSEYVNDKTIDMSNVDPNLVTTGKINDKLTGAVIASNTLALTYNPDVFSKAGVSAPTSDWKWADFEKDMITIKQKTGNYGIDKFETMSFFPYWVRQYGKTVYAADGTKLGYDDDKVLIEYFEMLKRLQDAGAMPNPDEWTQLLTKGKEAEPVVTGTGGSTMDWSNFPSIVSKSNPNLKLVTPPYSATGTKALWTKPAMFFSVANSSKNKKEAAKFISWLINDEDANKIMMTERGTSASSKVREALKPSLTAQQKEMFDYVDLAVKHSTKADAPEPAGVAEVLKVLNDSINTVLYKKSSSEDAAKQFRQKANEILARNSK
jgi:multiple sugar transport system substrate-binding protein